MEKLKKYFMYSFAAFLLLNLPINAQAKRGDTGEDHFRKMIEELDLSVDQKTELKELFKEHKKEMIKTEDEKRGDFHTSINKILNETQKEKFAEMIKNSPREKMKRRMDARVEKMATELELNSAQKEKLKEMMTENERQFVRNREFKKRRNCCDRKEFKRHHRSERLRDEDKDVE